MKKIKFKSTDINPKVEEADEILKAFDKILVAERMAVQYKIYYDFFGEKDKSALSLMTARENIIYSKKEEKEIVIIAKKLLREKYDLPVDVNSDWYFN